MSLHVCEEAKFDSIVSKQVFRVRSRQVSCILVLQPAWCMVRVPCQAHAVDKADSGLSTQRAPYLLAPAVVGVPHAHSVVVDEL